MKKSFFSFYAPTSDQYERLWKEGLIVLDTNVLLDLYRLPATARDELLAVLEKLKERLWIPHQVGLEFQRRRLTAMSAGNKPIEEALKSATDLVGKLKAQVDDLEIDKYGLGIDSVALIEDLSRANQKLTEAIKAVHDSQLKIAATDPIREKLDDIFLERVGSAPTNQKELDELMRDGEERFENKTPPGFADSEKDKSPNEATFIFDNLKYQRKFGDLILWRQLITHVKEKQIKAVLFVTGDKKEDWWWRERGKTIGPHTELAQEIVREGAVELFWMYLPEQFLRHAKTYAEAEVSDQSVLEIQQVQPVESALPATKHRRPIQEKILEAIHRKTAVFKWLKQRYREVTLNEFSFPDVLVRDDDGLHGYEVKSFRMQSRGIKPEHLAAVKQGINALHSEALTTFSVVLVDAEQEFYDPEVLDMVPSIKEQLTRLISAFPITKIIVGATIGPEFVSFFEIENPLH